MGVVAARSEASDAVAVHAGARGALNKPTLDWPSATELAEQVTRSIIQPR
jgi:hypothetical protein